MVPVVVGIVALAVGIAAGFLIRKTMAASDAQSIEAKGVRSGMTMDANLIVAHREGALLVPNRALRGDDLWVIEQGRLRKRAVKRGITGTERTEIVSGLADGETVVLSPAHGLRAGRRAHAASARGQ